MLNFIKKLFHKVPPPPTEKEMIKHLREQVNHDAVDTKQPVSSTPSEQPFSHLIDCIEITKQVARQPITFTFDSLLSFTWLIGSIVIVSAVFSTMIGCQKKNTKAPVVKVDNVQLLQEKADLYKSLIVSHQDKDGFILSSHCDASLFSGLIGIDPALNVNILAAYSETTGKFYRRPSQDCYPHESASEISRDMYLGILWYVWENKRLDIANLIWDYGSTNDWIMGSGVFTRTYFTPSMQALLARLIYALDGEDHATVRNIPIRITEILSNDAVIENGRPHDFAAHLEVLSILLVSEIDEGLSDGDLGVLRYHAKRNPKNALFVYAYEKYNSGNFSGVIETLLDTSHFPSDRLPTSGEHFEPWLWQRDLGKDWEPDTDKNKQHTGGDFLFVSYLLLKELNNDDQILKILMIIHSF